MRCIWRSQRYSRPNRQEEGGGGAVFNAMPFAADGTDFGEFRTTVYMEADVGVIV